MIMCRTGDVQVGSSKLGKESEVSRNDDVIDDRHPVRTTPHTSLKVEKMSTNNPIGLRGKLSGVNYTKIATSIYDSFLTDLNF